MDSVIRVETKADTFLWLRGLLKRSTGEQYDGLRAACHHALDNRREVAVIGSVGAGDQAPCLSKGLCAISETGHTSLPSLERAIRQVVEEEVRSELEAEFAQYKESLNRRRLASVVLSGDPDLHQPLTTILPICSVCWATESLHLDHVVPRSKGGPNEYANYQILCQPCNSSKTDKDMDEWMAWVNTSDDERAEKIRERRQNNAQDYCEWLG